MENKETVVPISGFGSGRIMKESQASHERQSRWFKMGEKHAMKKIEIVLRKRLNSAKNYSGIGVVDIKMSSQDLENLFVEIAKELNIELDSPKKDGG